MNTRLRLATVQDFQAVAALRKNTIGGEYWPQTFLNEISNAHHVFLIMETVSSELVAYGWIELTLPEASLIEMSVHPNVQRQGLGQLLLQELMARACSLGSEKIFLEVRASNAAARALYQKNGFKVISTRKRYYSKPEEDALVMEKTFLFKPSNLARRIGEPEKTV